VVDESRACQRYAADLQIWEALFDQSVWAGVGKIAKSEILFQAGFDPRIAVEPQVPRLPLPGLPPKKINDPLNCWVVLCG